MKKVLPLLHQNLFLHAPWLHPELRFHFLVGGYGCGKTRSLALMWLKVVFELNGKKDKAGDGPRILLGGVNIGHLLKTTLVYIFEYLDSTGTKYTFDKKNNRIFVGNTITILVSLSDPQHIQGYDVTACIMEEVDDLNAADPDAATFEAVRSCNERLRQVVLGARAPFMAIGTTAQGQRGLYRVYTTFKKGGVGFTLTRGRTRDNPYLDKSYVESQYKYLSPQEVECFLEGKFIALAQGRVFPDWDWERNFQPTQDMDLEVGDDEEVYIAMDFNNFGCRATAHILRRGVIYGIKRYDFQNPGDSPMVWRHDFPHNKIIFIPDATSNKEILTYYKKLRQYGIWWAASSKNKSVEDSVFAVNSLLRAGRLVYTRAAKETAEALAGFMRDKNNQVPSAKAPGDYGHDVDSARYVVGYLLRTQASLLDVYKATLMRKDNKGVLDDEEQVVEQNGGYVLMGPGAL